MPLTLLLDLDDTLLSNQMDTFMPAYLQALAGCLADRFAGDHLVGSLLSATRRMVANPRIDRTLEEVFDAAFYPALGIERIELQPAIDIFYREIFPTLRRLTAPRPQAIRLVETAITRGYRIAIATNPLFPRTATLQRLAWAELPANRYPFEIVSTYEGFHFTKADPAYYLEVLAQMGGPAGPAVMVGDDQEMDVHSASQAGLSTYLLDERLKQYTPVDGTTAHVRGPLGKVIDWLDQIDKSGPPIETATPTALLATLKATPAALATLTRNLSDERWSARPAQGEWSIGEVVCHLRDVDREVNLPRLEKVIRENHPFIPGIDTDRWADERAYFQQDGCAALREFIETRKALLQVLDNPDLAAWNRPARHAIFGPTRLIELVSFIATHDRAHVGQVYQTLQALDEAHTPDRVNHPYG